MTPPGQACGSPGSKGGVWSSAHPSQEKLLLPKVQGTHVQAFWSRYKRGTCSGGH